MSSPEQDKQRLIQDFRAFLEKVPDDRNGIHIAIDFLSSIIRIRTFIPPTAEIITILKRRKPVLFQFLKKVIAPTSPLYFVIQLDMDYETALERLQLPPDHDSAD
jgi:hypothetical protein